MRYLLLTCILLLATGCGQPTTTEVVYKDIDRVFMHDWNTVSFFRQNSDGSIEHKFLYSHLRGDIKYFSDVPEKQKMWAKEIIVDGNMTTDRYVEIHLHSVNEVAGGEWDHGKHGSGTVSVVE
jgi:hypothetical protein